MACNIGEGFVWEEGLNESLQSISGRGHGRGHILAGQGGEWGLVYGWGYLHATD